MDILLGHALFMALDPKQAARRRPYPPLGTLYAAAGLRDAGWRVRLFDAMLAAGPADFSIALERHAPRCVLLYEDSFNFLSKMCLGRMREAALSMVRAAGDRGLPVAVCGSDATDNPAVYLAAGAEAVILGEGDRTVIEVADALLCGNGPHARRQRLDGVAGVASQGSDGSLRGTTRPPARDPDRFPWPARDLADIDAYRRIWQAAHGRFSMNMVTSRGCPYHCNWCAKPIWGQRYALRSVTDVAAEMAQVKARYGPDHIWFADDIFGLRTDWTAAFGDAVLRADARIPFTIQSRVDLMTAEAVRGLAAAGCETVWLGVESGSQRVLDAMEKGIRVADVPGAVGRLRAAGIRACYFLQLGYPGERWRDIEATIDLVGRTVPDAIGISVSYPLPGTPFHDFVARGLGPKRHWRESGDLAMMFAGTYRTPFYRRLRDGLHAYLDALHLERSDTTPGEGETAVARAEAALRRLAADRAAWRSPRPTAAPTEGLTRP